MIEHPTRWIQLEPTNDGIRATCLRCHAGRTFSTMAQEIYLDEITEAMIDHIERNHGDEMAERSPR